MFIEFNIKNIGGYHDLYVQSDILSLADVFENLRSKCIEIYEHGPVHFLSVPRSEWEAALKKNGVKLELWTDINMLLMVKTEIRGD